VWPRTHPLRRCWIPSWTTATDQRAAGKSIRCVERHESGSGSIRIHRRDVQRLYFRRLGLTDEERRRNSDFCWNVGNRCSAAWWLLRSYWIVGDVDCGEKSFAMLFFPKLRRYLI